MSLIQSIENLNKITVNFISLMHTTVKRVLIKSRLLTHM